MKKQIEAFIIGGFSLVGVAAAYEALLAHYGEGNSTICNLGESFSCDIVNQSSYSAIFGIPFALLGIIGYVSMFALMVALVVRKNEKEREILFAALCALASIGLGIQVYLTLMEALFIHVWCLMCLISQVSILAVTVTAWIWRQKSLTKTHA